MNEINNTNRKRLIELVESGKMRFYLKKIYNRSEISGYSLHFTQHHPELKALFYSLSNQEIMITDYMTGELYEYNLQGRLIWTNNNTIYGLKKIFDVNRPKLGDIIGIGIDLENDHNIVINFKLGQGIVILCKAILDYMGMDVNKNYLIKILDSVGIQPDNTSLSFAESILIRKYIDLQKYRRGSVYQ